MNTNSDANDAKIIDEMADAMRRFGDGCTRDQLTLQFTSAEIDRFCEKARARANEQAVYQRRARVAANAVAA